MDGIFIMYLLDGYGLGVFMIVKNLISWLDDFGIGFDGVFYKVFVYLDFIGVK